MKQKFLSLLGVFCLLCTSQVWGYNASNAHIYYDNTKSQWSSKNVSIMIGRDHDWGGGNGVYSQYITMSKIENTNLYVKTSFSWSNYDSFMFFTHGDWGTSSESSSPDKRVEHGDNYSGDYNVDMSECHLFVSTGSNKGDGLQYYDNTSHVNLLNKSVTIQIMLSVDGGATYNTTDTYYGDIEAIRYTFSSDHKTSVSQSKKNFPTTTNYVTSALSAIVSFTESNTTKDYVFKGWGKTANAIDATDASWTYLCTGDATVYVYFMKDTKNLIVSAEDGKGTATGTVNNIVTFADYYEIQAYEGSGYRFKEWSVTNGSVNYVDGYSATSNPTRIIIDDNVAIKATFVAPMTIYFVPTKHDVEAGYNFFANIQYTSTEDKWKSGDMELVPDVQYHCRPIYKFTTEFTSLSYPIGYIQCQTKDESAYKWQWENKSQTTISGWNGQMIVADGTSTGEAKAYATETCFDITLESEDDDKGSVSVSSITTFLDHKTEITATPQYGYLFDKWVGSDGVSFDDVTKATTNVSATKAGTVTATFKDGPLEAGVWTQWKDKEFPSTQFMRVKSTDHIAVTTVEITDATKTYDFKYSKANGNWHGNTGYITPATTFESWWSFESMSGKTLEQQAYYWCHIQPSGVGTLTIKINLDEDRIYVSMPYDLKITAAGYASFYGENNLTIPDGLTVKYIADATEEEISWMPVSSIIPKHTGVILSGEPGTYTAFTTTDAGTAAEGNLLLGTDEQTEIAENGKPHYVLSNGEFGVGMYFPNFDSVDDITGIGAFTNGAHKAYLELNPASGVTPRRIPFSPRQTPTEVVNVSENENINSKMLINNQLIIIREGKQYNAQGQIIK